MGRPILSVPLVTKVGQRDLTTLVVTPQIAAEEAGIGRGLHIGSCPAEKMLGHVSRAVANSVKEHCIIVAPTAIHCESVQSELDDRGIRASCTHQRGHARDCVRVVVSVPERLTAIKDWWQNGFRPLMVHVIDPPGAMVKYDHLTHCVPASKVFWVKSTYEGHRILPYVIYWTEEECRVFDFRTCSNYLGVDGFRYGNGRKVRTASLAPEDA